MANGVGSVASFLVERLGKLLIEEFTFLDGVSAQVKQMEIELNRMQCFLEAAEEKRVQGNKIVRNWVAEMRELSLDAEDVIATFVVKVALRRRSGGIHHVLKRYLCVFSESKARHKVGLEILDINKKIADLARSLQTYIPLSNALGVISTSTSEKENDIRRSYAHVPVEDIVGFDKDVDEVVNQLVNENCRVVAIWGMGGLGKTTLAKRVYNHSEVRRHFECFAWAYISQQCKTKEVLEGILFELLSLKSEKERKRVRELKYDELAKELYDLQSDKKCLVILDDIWEGEAWDRLHPGFPNTSAEGSKILLTTRNREVALHVDQECHPHELRHLTPAESWELFLKKAFPRREESILLSDERTALGKAMVKHCGGLPLAIVVLGGLLATKPTLEEWQKVSNNLELSLRKGKGQVGVPVTSVLDLSYNDLPYHFKACFLCLSDLPEDEGIRPVKLVQKWIAEGFVSLSVTTRVGNVIEETTLDVGMSYLDELHQRSMILAGPLTRFSRRVKFYRLYDLVRDMCLFKAQEENFIKVVCMGGNSATTTSSSSSSTTIRRLGVYRMANETVGGSGRGGYVKLFRIDEKWNLHQVRSCQFYFFGNTLEDFDWRHVKRIFKGFKLLTFLDLKKIEFIGKNKKLPKAIGNLIHLRYLSTRDSEIADFSSSIGNLRFLETLDLRSKCYKVKIPNVLWRLEELRHLYLPRFKEGRHGPFKVKLRLDGLSKLETLEGFNAKTCNVKSFSTLTNLRKLEITVYGPKDLAVILESPSLSNSNRLLRYSSFVIKGSYQTREEQILLRQVLGYRHLHKLVLRGISLIEFPDDIGPNLTHLTLYSDPGLKEDPMPTLEKLPNLRRLVIRGIWKKMVCSARGFPQLIELELWCSELEEWRVEQGAMPSLLNLEMYRFEKLKEIPDGLRFVTTLRELRILFASQELKDRLQEGGADFSKIQHVHSIVIR